MSVYICDVHNNLVWALTIWAVALINEDRIGNIVHDNILEMYIKSSSRWGSKPCFDSNTIRCTAKGATNYSNSWNWLFILVLSKISNADTMARSQVIWLIVTSWVPSPMEMQSSPVPTLALVMVMLEECPMWIPLVLGLFPGAVMVTCWICKLLHP